MEAAENNLGPDKKFTNNTIETVTKIAIMYTLFMAWLDKKDEEQNYNK